MYSMFTSLPTLTNSKEVRKMEEYNCDLLLQQQILEESIREFEILNRGIAELSLRREKVSKELIAVLGHEHDGQKTYEYEMWKIEVKTPCVYSLDKKKYESVKSKIPDALNPVKESVSYSLDKRLCDRFLMDAPDDVRDVLCSVIEKRPGKASVSIKERLQ